MQNPTVNQSKPDHPRFPRLKKFFLFSLWIIFGSQIGELTIRSGRLKGYKTASSVLLVKKKSSRVICILSMSYHALIETNLHLFDFFRGKNYCAWKNISQKASPGMSTMANCRNNLFMRLDPKRSGN